MEEELVKKLESLRFGANEDQSRMLDKVIDIVKNYMYEYSDDGK